MQLICNILRNLGFTSSPKRLACGLCHWRPGWFHYGETTEPAGREKFKNGIWEAVTFPSTLHFVPLKALQELTQLWVWIIFICVNNIYLNIHTHRHKKKKTFHHKGATWNFSSKKTSCVSKFKQLPRVLAAPYLNKDCTNRTQGFLQQQAQLSHEKKSL